MDAPSEAEVLALFHGAAKRIDAFLPGQWDAIRAVLGGAGTTLLVQRTGWGKSLVYFAAALALRRRGGGAAVLISPLIALMRDQVRAARELGLTAVGIHSENEAEWPGILADLDGDRLDLLLISPERLASAGFVARHLEPAMRHLGLFVIDEAHCLSDWGHDFRPDFRRIHRLLAAHLPAHAAVLATTATANARVVTDLEAELGPCRVVRGPLARGSLALQVVRLSSLAERYAWLAERLPVLEGRGIVYAATRHGCETLAAWLAGQGIAAAAYHAGLTAEGERARLEEALRSGTIKTLVATSALGMGFDMPDLAFVIHLQAPASPVHYYQQVGRAGRALDHAYGVLLGGAQDSPLIHRFIDRAFPTPTEMRAALDAIEDAEGWIAQDQAALAAGLGERTMEATLRYLAALDPAPVEGRGGLWRATLAPWRDDEAWRRQVTDRRRDEWRRMQDYATTRDCLMQFLTRELDDVGAPCGRCANCLGHTVLAPGAGRTVTQRARAWLAARGVEDKAVPTVSPGWMEAIRALLRIDGRNGGLARRRRSG